MTDTPEDIAARAACLQKIADDEAQDILRRDTIRKNLGLYEPTNLDIYEDGMGGTYQGWYN
jgi:hypothetical protein